MKKCIYGIVCTCVVLALNSQAQIEFTTPTIFYEPITNRVDLSTNAAPVGELKRELVIVDDGAVGEFGLHKVKFSSDIASERPIQVRAPGGRMLYSRPSYLVLHDLSNDKTVLVAEVTNTIGSLVSSNIVLYQNAFNTLKAHIMYKYTLSGLEQDVILEEVPELPQDFDPEATRLELWTAWFDSEPVATETIKIRERNMGAKGLVREDDDFIDFGGMRIVQDGTAFRINDKDQKVKVFKNWVKVGPEQASFLIEGVDMDEAQSFLADLPKVPLQASTSGGSFNLERAESLYAAHTRTKLPPTMLLAGGSLPKSGFVLDYVMVNGMQVPDGVVSWYSAENNANTSIGTVHGTYTFFGTYSGGKVGSAFDFTAGGYVTVPDSPTNRFSGPMTVMAWIRRNSDSGSRSLVSKWYTSDGYKSWRLMLETNNTVYFGGTVNGSSSTEHYAVSTSVIPLDTWTHVVGTYDGQYFSIYVNGELESQVAHASGIFAGTRPLYFGSLDGGNSFVGKIDEVGLYSRALSPTEVKQVFDAGGGAQVFGRTCIAPPSGLVAWFPGGGASGDIINNLQGTMWAGATYTVGKVGDAFYFDGTDDYMSVPNNAVLNPALLTIEAWVFSYNSYLNAPIVSKDNTSGSRQYLLTFSETGKFRAHVWTTTGLMYFDGNTLAQLNTWYHVAMTYDGTNLKLYVNGLADGGATLPAGTMITTAEPIHMGGSYSGVWGNYKLKGMIDEVSIYNRALASTEIVDLFAAGSSGKCAPGNVDTDGDGMPDWWEKEYGLNPQSATDGGTTDSDGDGITNLQEYIYELNPRWRDAIREFTGEPKTITNTKTLSNIP